MEASILTSTKKILGIGAGYNVFDLDIITHINSTFAIVSQFGIGPLDGFSIEDEKAEWGDFGSLSEAQLNLLRTYMFLRVRMLFDPPTTSFLIEATNKQIQEYEQRLVWGREELVPFPVEEV